MVTSGKHFNGGCCFDYGNSETDRKADGAGAMDAINFSSITAWGTGAGNGPWVMADLEYGVFAQNNTDEEPERSDPDRHVRHRRAEEQRHDGVRPQGRRRDCRQAWHVLQGRAPRGMEPDEEAGRDRPRQRRRLLQTGGGANLSAGTFYEGCIVTGYPSDATENAVQANIVAAGYGK